MRIGAWDEQERIISIYCSGEPVEERRAGAGDGMEGRKRPGEAVCRDQGVGGGDQSQGVKDSASEIQISIQGTNRFV